MRAKNSEMDSPRFLPRYLEGTSATRRARAVALLRSLGGTPREWSNSPGDRYGEHAHPYFKVLFCLEGSIEFHSDDCSVRLNPGDRLDLPEGTLHAATVGPQGVVCVEAALPAPPADIPPPEHTG